MLSSNPELDSYLSQWPQNTPNGRGETMQDSKLEREMPDRQRDGNLPHVPSASASGSAPWLNDDGNAKSNDELKEIAKSWKPTDWEDYLASLETYQREEYLGSGRAVERLSNEKHTAALVDILQSDEYPHLTSRVESILASLSQRQRIIVRLRYWENKTLKEIAAMLGIRYQSVQDSLKSSHLKIGEKLRLLAAKKVCKDVIS